MYAFTPRTNAASLFGPKKPLEVVSVPPVFVRDEMQITIPESSEALNLRAPALSIAILQHHALEVVLRLRVPISKERGFLSFTHDMRHTVVVAVGCYLPRERIRSPNRHCRA